MIWRMFTCAISCSNAASSLPIGTTFILVLILARIFCIVGASPPGPPPPTAPPPPSGPPGPPPPTERPPPPVSKYSDDLLESCQEAGSWKAVTSQVCACSSPSSFTGSPASQRLPSICSESNNEDEVLDWVLEGNRLKLEFSFIDSGFKFQSIHLKCPGCADRSSMGFAFFSYFNVKGDYKGKPIVQFLRIPDSDWFNFMLPKSISTPGNLSLIYADRDYSSEYVVTDLLFDCDFLNEHLPNPTAVGNTDSDADDGGIDSDESGNGNINNGNSDYSGSNDEGSYTTDGSDVGALPPYDLDLVTISYPLSNKGLFIAFGADCPPEEIATTSTSTIATSTSSSAKTTSTKEPTTVKSSVTSHSSSTVTSHSSSTVTSQSSSTVPSSTLSRALIPNTTTLGTSKSSSTISPTTTATTTTTTTTTAISTEHLSFYFCVFRIGNMVYDSTFTDVLSVAYEQKKTSIWQLLCDGYRAAVGDLFNNVTTLYFKPGSVVVYNVFALTAPLNDSMRQSIETGVVRAFNTAGWVIVEPPEITINNAETNRSTQVLTYALVGSLVFIVLVILVVVILLLCKTKGLGCCAGGSSRGSGPSSQYSSSDLGERPGGQGGNEYYERHSIGLGKQHSARRVWQGSTAMTLAGIDNGYSTDFLGPPPSYGEDEIISQYLNPPSKKQPLKSPRRLARSPSYQSESPTEETPPYSFHEARKGPGLEKPTSNRDTIPENSQFPVSYIPQPSEQIGSPFQEHFSGPSRKSNSTEDTPNSRIFRRQSSYDSSSTLSVAPPLHLPRPKRHESGLRKRRKRTSSGSVLRNSNLPNNGYPYIQRGNEADGNPAHLRRQFSLDNDYFVDDERTDTDQQTVEYSSPITDAQRRYASNKVEIPRAKFAGAFLPTSHPFRPPPVARADSSSSGVHSIEERRGIGETPGGGQSLWGYGARNRDSVSVESQPDVLDMLYARKNNMGGIIGRGLKSSIRRDNSDLLHRRPARPSATPMPRQSALPRTDNSAIYLQQQQQQQQQRYQDLYSEKTVSIPDDRSSEARSLENTRF